MATRGRPSNAKREQELNEKYEKYQSSKDGDEQRLRDILGEHSVAAEQAMSTLNSSWDEKEAMLICRLKDDISTKSKVHSGVFDPRLSTIVFERSARVMAQNPFGKAYAVSRDDVGKNMFMNLMLRYYQKNANMWHSMVIKSRLLDLYSLVYGTMFALVTWVVDPKRDYIGPEMIPLPIRTCFPQPGATSIADSDWFQVSSMKNFSWLESQAKLSPKWKNVDKLKDLLLGDKIYGSGDSRPDEQASFVERTWYSSYSGGDKAFPEVELKTEYRRDRWITFAPKYDNLILRDIENPYHNGEIPIVAKHCFPLLDSIIGLGEFERGKTLQYAINSLINLYLDGVKYSIFPPIQVDPNSVIASTIKWGPGEKWLTKHPGVDVRQLKMSPLGLNTFNSTYGFLISSLMNQAGTTDVNTNSAAEPTMGRTPQALRLMNSREGARDEWDRTMMEDTLKSIYKKWIDMIVAKQEKKIAVRLYGEEAKRIAADYPDIAEFFERDNYGIANIGKAEVNAKYDYELEAGSTMKADLEGENNNLSQIMSLLLKNPVLIQAMREKGKDVDLGELFKRWLISGGMKDYDRIIIDYTPEQAQEDQQTTEGQQDAAAAPQMEQLQQMMGAIQGQAQGAPQGGPQPPQPPQTPEEALTPEMAAQLGGPTLQTAAPTAPAPMAPVAPVAPAAPQPSFSDPDISQLFGQITQAVGGLAAVPPMGGNNGR